MKFVFLSTLAICLLLLSFTHASSQSPTIPFDTTNAVFYDNDDYRDTYTDEYLLSLASAGTIQLKGLVTTYSADSAEYNLFVKGRQQIINKARKSGFMNLPDAIAGPNVTLKRPASNRVEDTKPLNSKAGRAIVKAALAATPAKPLVIVAGGQLTSIADAYLQDPAISDHVIVSGIFGARDKTYNAGLDPWAWTIVLLKFRCLSISDSNSDSLYNRVFKTACPRTPKKRFAREIQNGILPNTEFYKWMLEKHHPRHPASYMEQDGDTPAAIPIVRPDYVQQIERWRCTGLNENGLPNLVKDDNGPLYLVISANVSIGTDEFWRAIENRRSTEHKKPKDQF